MVGVKKNYKIEKKGLDSEKISGNSEIVFSTDALFGGNKCKKTDRLVGGEVSEPKCHFGAFQKLKELKSIEYKNCYPDLWSCTKKHEIG